MTAGREVIPVLYHDSSIVVCVKPYGFLSEHSDNGDDSVPDMLIQNKYAERLYPVHRLDRVVSGVMVYAKTKMAAAALSAAVQASQLTKAYLAVIHGVPQGQTGEMTDYLIRDGALGKAFVTKPEKKGSREARLSYQTLESIVYTAPEDTTASEVLSLVRVNLFTGRFHQIRVQFATREMPVCGDGKYGSRMKCRQALFAQTLTFPYPVTNHRMTFSATPDGVFPFTLFSQSLLQRNEIS